ncbi:MAG: DoxX family protein [Novosphingobium sp.]|nr:DoxX family protein [Novosphingobium sp.]
MSKIAAIIGRSLIALIFIVSGVNKLFDMAGTNETITSVGLPSGLAIPVGVFELVAGLCLALGFMVRLVSLLLVAFTALTIVFFHYRFTDPMQAAMALKNIAIIGGLFLAFAHSQMWSHYYSIRRESSAARKLHEAELRAARAEGAAQAASHSSHDAVVTDVDHDGVPEVRRKRRLFDW